VLSPIRTKDVGRSRGYECAEALAINNQGKAFSGRTIFRWDDHHEVPFFKVRPGNFTGKKSWNDNEPCCVPEGRVVGVFTNGRCNLVG
jgi:hypothetical protein